MFQTLALILLLVAAAFVLLPLWWRSRSEFAEDELLRREANIALFQERNDELEAELAEGRIDQQQYQALLLELQSSLLSDTDDGTQGGVAEKRESAATKRSKPTKQARPASPRGSIVVPVAMLALIPLVAFVLYGRWGFMEDVQLMDEYRRTVENQGNPDGEVARDLVYALGEALQGNEDNPWPNYFMAENLSSIGLFEQAEVYYQRAADNFADGGERALMLGRVALAKYILSDFEMTPEILSVINQARAINPNEVSMLQLLAADAQNREAWDEAIEYWRLLIQASPNSQQAQVYRQLIAQAQQLLAPEESGSGPSVDVTLRLADGLEVSGDERVFIAVRNADREGMPPLAAIDLSAAELPATFTLDNSSAVGPFNLASAETVYVSALLSLNNSATAQSGDYRVVSESFSHNGQHTDIELTLAERVP